MNEAWYANAGTIFLRRHVDKIGHRNHEYWITEIEKRSLKVRDSNDFLNFRDNSFDTKPCVTTYKF